MDPKLFAALIAGAFGVISVCVSALVSLMVSRHTVKANKARMAIEYLTRKIETLEQAKKKLVKNRVAKHDDDAESDLAGQAAVAVKDSFDTASRLFLEVRHHLPPGLYDQLNGKHEGIKKSFSTGWASAHGLKVSTEAPEVDGGEVIKEMADFPDAFLHIVDCELVYAVQRINELTETDVPSE